MINSHTLSADLLLVMGISLEVRSSLYFAFRPDIHRAHIRILSENTIQSHTLYDLQVEETLESYLKYSLYSLNMHET